MAGCLCLRNSPRIWRSQPVLHRGSWSSPSPPVPRCPDGAGYQEMKGGAEPVPASRLAGKPFAHKYALVSALQATPGLLVAEGGIEALVLGHRLVRIEADLAIPAAHRFGLRERQQTP